MDIVKTKSGRLAIQLYDEKGVKGLITLRTIAVTGLMAVGLSAALTVASKEISYQMKMNDVGKLMLAADEIEEMGSKANIEIGGQTVFIPDEIREYADAKKDLIENKDSEDIEKYEQKVREEGIDINNITEQIIIDNITPSFMNPEAGTITTDEAVTPAGPEYVAKQYDNFGNQKEVHILNGNFVDAYGQNNKQEQIELMQEALENGEGIQSKRSSR